MKSSGLDKKNMNSSGHFNGKWGAGKPEVACLTSVFPAQGTQNGRSGRRIVATGPKLAQLHPRIVAT